MTKTTAKVKKEPFLVTEEEKTFFRQRRLLKKEGTKLEEKRNAAWAVENANKLASKQLILNEVFRLLQLKDNPTYCAFPFPREWSGHALWETAAEQKLRPFGLHQEEFKKSWLPLGPILKRLYYAVKEMHPNKRFSFEELATIACREHYEKTKIAKAYGIIVVRKAVLQTALTADDRLGNWWGIPLPGNIPFILKVGGTENDFRLIFPENFPLGAEKKDVYRYERREHYWFLGSLEEALKEAVFMAAQNPDPGNGYRLPPGSFSAPAHKSLRGMMTYSGISSDYQGGE